MNDDDVIDDEEFDEITNDSDDSDGLDDDADLHDDDVDDEEPDDELHDEMIDGDPDEDHLDDELDDDEMIDDELAHDANSFDDALVVSAPLVRDRRSGPLGWSEVGRSMRRFWLPLLPLAAIAVVLAVTLGQSESDVFRSEVDLVFAPSVDLPETYETADALDILSDRVLQGTYIELTESRTLRDVAIQVGQLEPALIDDTDVDGAIAQEANVITVGVEAPSAPDAVALSSSLADVTIERFQQLYPIIEVTIIDEPTVPDGPNGVDVFQTIVLALAAAFFVWMVLAVVIGRLRT